jgi:hypothetical protein
MGKDRHTGPSGWGLVVGLTSSHLQIQTVSKPEQWEGHGLKIIRSAADQEEKGGRGWGEAAHTRTQTGTRTPEDSTAKIVLSIQLNAIRRHNKALNSPLTELYYWITLFRFLELNKTKLNKPKLSSLLWKIQLLQYCRPLCTIAINTSTNVSKQKIKILPPFLFCIKALPVSSSTVK